MFLYIGRVTWWKQEPHNPSYNYVKSMKNECSVRPMRGTIQIQLWIPLSVAYRRSARRISCVSSVGLPLSSTVPIKDGLRAERKNGIANTSTYYIYILEF